MKQIIQTEDNIVTVWESQLARGEPVGYLQAWPRIWTQGCYETNTSSGQSRTQTLDWWIVSPTH